MRFGLAFLLLMGALLAGCSEEPASIPTKGSGVTGTTGAIRGVVVDQSITPVAGVELVLNSGQETTSDLQGLFTFTGLPAGDYFVKASKPGYSSIQAAVPVVAGVDPALLRIQVTHIPGTDPYVTTLLLDGYYECAFGGNFGVLLITDSCDFGYRTVWDTVNDTVGTPPAPRTLQKTENTLLHDVPADVESIVMQVYWENPTVKDMLVELGSTPIDPACDCSARYWIQEIGPSPLVGRLDRVEGENGTFPVGIEVASRGFLNWEGDPVTAQNFRFTLVTTLYHNHRPA